MFFIPLPRGARSVFASRIALVLVLAVTGPAPHAAESVAVQLSWHHQFQFAGYYVAKEKGYYREAGLEVELRAGGPSAPRPSEAVADGRAEFGVGNAGVAIDRMNGAPLVALAAILQSSAAVWIGPGRLERFDLQAWRTRPRHLPFQPSDASELIIPFRSAGANIAAEPDTHGPTHPGRSHLGEVRAAYASTDLFQAERAGLEFSVFDPRDHGVDFYGEVQFTSEDFLRRRAGLVARFRAATLRGWEDAFDDVEGTARMITERYAPASQEDALVFEGRTLRRLARPESVELGHMSRNRWEGIARMQHEHGFGKRALDVAEFLPELTPGANPLWPDPVRVTFAGVLVALILGALQLLRVNGRLLRANRALVESGRAQRADGVRFQFLMDVAPFPIVIFALADGRVSYANDRALAWADPSDMLGQPIQDWIPGLAPAQPLSDRLLGGRALREHETELPPGPDGVSRWCSVTGRVIEYDGTHCAFVAFSDITARKNAEREVRMLSDQRALILRDVETLQTRLREASLRDALTGLHNRRYFDMTAPREIARCRREGLSLGLLVVDADHFKRINDGHGHAAGDEVLRALGAMLMQTFRTEDVVCRFGGEEFVVLMPGSTEAGCRARAEALREAVAALVVPGPNGDIRFTVSIGVAVGPADSQTPESLFARADGAVYEAKAAGRNRVMVSLPSSPSRFGGLEDGRTQSETA